MTSRARNPVLSSVHLIPSFMIILSFLYLIPSSTMVSGSISVPFWLVGRNSEPHVYATIGSGTHPVVVKVVYRSPLSDYLRMRCATGPTVISLGEHEFFDLFVHENLARNGVVQELEVGPGSYLMRNISSISVLKHTSQLVLNSTEDEFLESACQTDSLSTLPFFADPSIVLGWISSSVSGDFFLHQGRRSVSFSSIDAGAMFLLPQELAAEIHHILLSIGAYPTVPEFNGEMRFTRCVMATTVSRLPVFTLVLTDREGTILSRISISGDDYMSFDSIQQTCRSKFRVRGPGDDTDSFIIDPFQIPGINVRATDRDISFCDAI